MRRPIVERVACVRRWSEPAKDKVNADLLAFFSLSRRYKEAASEACVSIGEKHMTIPESISELIAKAPLAHLTTLNSTGSPQVTVVWVGIENDEFVIGHLATHQKVKNIRRDARVALSVLSDRTNAQGLREYLVVYGKARVTEGGAVDLLQRLARI